MIKQSHIIIVILKTENKSNFRRGPIMRKTVKRKCSVLLTLTLLLNCGAFLGVRAETSGETKEPQETAEEVVSLKTGRFLMIF